MCLNSSGFHTMDGFFGAKLSDSNAVISCVVRTVDLNRKIFQRFQTNQAKKPNNQMKEPDEKLNEEPDEKPGKEANRSGSEQSSNI